MLLLTIYMTYIIEYINSYCLNSLYIDIYDIYCIIIIIYYINCLRLLLYSMIIIKNNDIYDNIII